MAYYTRSYALWCRQPVQTLFSAYLYTENGQSCNDRIYADGKVHDADRIDYVSRYLSELRKAIDEGVPVRGYLHWSFLDNFEWSYGYDERFGMVYVDYLSQRRIMKDSALWYKEVIKSNGKTV